MRRRLAAAGHDLKQVLATHPEGRVVGAGVDAAGIVFGPDQIAAQIAGGRHPSLRLLVHRDVAVGTVRGAEPAADAVVLNHDLDGAGMIFPRLAVNRIDGTTDEAVGVEAGAAGAGHEIILEPQPLADQPRNAFVRV